MKRPYCLCSDRYPCMVIVRVTSCWCFVKPAYFCCTGLDYLQGHETNEMLPRGGSHPPTVVLAVLASL